jgi:tRNA 2-thiouridine synthesizing protein D
MVKFALVLIAEPYKHEAADTMLNLAESILRKGHEIVGIFLYGSGVYLGKGGRNLSKNSRDLPKRLSTFINENKINLTACSTWISITGIKQDEFVEGLNQEGLGRLSYYMAQSDRVVVFGSGV